MSLKKSNNRVGGVLVSTNARVIIFTLRNIKPV